MDLFYIHNYWFVLRFFFIRKWLQLEEATSFWYFCWNKHTNRYWGGCDAFIISFKIEKIFFEVNGFFVRGIESILINHFFLVLNLFCVRISMLFVSNDLCSKTLIKFELSMANLDVIIFNKRGANIVRGPYWFKNAGSDEVQI